MRHSQKGMSFFGWLAVIVLIVFGLVIAMKLIPIYLDHFALRDMVTKVNEDPTVEINSIREFNSYIDKGMRINSIRDINAREAIKITASGANAYTVQIVYEVRTPALQNVDLLVHFDETHIVRPIK
jgi:nitrogen fixation protein FixH